jgi:hypothetical protein
MNSQCNNRQSRNEGSTTSGEDYFVPQFYEPSLSVAQAPHLASAINLYNTVWMQEILPQKASNFQGNERSESASLPCEAQISRQIYPQGILPLRSQSCNGRLESWCLDPADPARNTATCSEQCALGFSFMPSSHENQQPSVHRHAPSAAAIVGLEILLNKPSDVLWGDDCDSLSTTSTVKSM